MDKELRKSKKLGCVDDLADDVIHPRWWEKYVWSTRRIVSLGDEVTIWLDGDKAVGPYKPIGMELDHLSDVIGGLVFYEDHGTWRNGWVHRRGVDVTVVRKC